MVQVALVLILLATLFCRFVEGCLLLDSFHFSVVTIATAGFGDLSPTTALGKVFTVIFIFAGVGIFVPTVSAIARPNLCDDKPPE